MWGLGDRTQVLMHGNRCPLLVERPIFKSVVQWPGYIPTSMPPELCHCPIKH